MFNMLNVIISISIKLLVSLFIIAFLITSTYSLYGIFSNFQSWNDLVIHLTNLLTKLPRLNALVLS